MPKTQSPNGTIDYTLLSRAKRAYEWYEMDRAEGDEESTPLRVKVQQLTPREMQQVPAGDALIKDVLQECAHFIVAWNLTATNQEGEELPVPPPAELNNVADVVENLLTHKEMTWLYNVIKQGHVIRMLQEKKALKRLGTTAASSPEDSSPDAT